MSAASPGMYAAHVMLLWALLTLSTLMTTAGTLALIAIFGSIGQLLAVFLVAYRSLASSGATVPVQALRGLFRTISHVESLRNTLRGTQAILYFGARSDAGLTTSLVVLACELVFWAAVSLGAMFWQDHRHSERTSQNVIDALTRPRGRRGRHPPHASIN